MSIPRSRWQLPLFLFLLVTVLSILFATSAESADDNNGSWAASFYNNTTFSGDPVHTATHDVIDFNWGENAPVADTVNADNFSIRWLKTTTFEAGTYRFTASADDGIRVYIDDKLILSEWWDHPLRTYSEEVYVAAGEHTVRVEYYERTEQSIVSVKYELTQAGGTPPTAMPTATATPASAATPVPTSAPADNSPDYSLGPELAACSNRAWFATYWNNKFLAGPSVLTRNEGNINYNWRQGSPHASINSDNFSASWTSAFNLQEGAYRFTATADDGVLIWVNNRQILNLWWQHTAVTRSVDYYHPGGPIQIRVEYFEAADDAQIAVTCALTSPQQGNTGGSGSGGTGGTGSGSAAPTATPVPAPTATPNPLLTANAGSCVISNVGALNLRSGPGLAYAIVTTLNRGQVTTRTGETSGKWVQIRTAENQIGWINGYYCGDGSNASSSSSSVSYGSVMVTTGALYVRSGAGTSFDWIELVFGGDSLTLVGQRNAAGDWILVDTSTGRRGWVYAPLTTATSAQIAALSVSN